MRGIFDTHAHYDDRAFDEDREEILAQLKEQGYSGIVDTGASFESCKKADEIQILMILFTLQWVFILTV